MDPLVTLMEGVYAAICDTEGLEDPVKIEEESRTHGEAEKENFYRFNGLFFCCRKCGMSYMEEDEVLKNWLECGAHGESCHVVDRACRCVEKLIDMKEVIINK